MYTGGKHAYHPLMVRHLGKSRSSLTVPKEGGDTSIALHLFDCDCDAFAGENFGSTKPRWCSTPEKVQFAYWRPPTKSLLCKGGSGDDSVGFLE